MKKVMLLGSGELGRELTISLKRLGCTVIAVDNYPWPYRGKDAPAQQVADLHVHCDMLNDNQLYNVIKWHGPDIIVPEIEAINTETLIKLEEEGMHVVPSANAVDKTMNRDRIRDRASEIGLTTAKFDYAEDLEQLIKAGKNYTKAVIKPVMSSSGKGQSVVEDCSNTESLEDSWQYACDNMRGSRPKVIIEEFIEFDFEITLLTIQQDSRIHFCDPIVHIQQDGDFIFSQQFESNNFWQLHPDGTLLQMDRIQTIINKAQIEASKIVKDLTGDGLFGVEFFVRGHDVIFSELSPRPHDTGLVTLKSQNYSQFDLHARAILGMPIGTITTTQSAQCHTINSDKVSAEYQIHLDKVSADVDVHLFNKPNATKGRRLGLVFSNDAQAGQNALKSIEITYKD